MNFSLTTVAMYIAFSADSFNPFVEQLAFGFSEFLGALGGLMGLFAGMSVISAIEVGFHILKIFVEKLSDRRLLKVHAIEVASTPNASDPSVRKRVFRYFVKTVAKSDVHGLHFLVDKGRKLWERVFWALIVFLLAIFCFQQIFDVIMYSEDNPIEFGIDEKVWTLNDVSSGPLIQFRKES